MSRQKWPRLREVQVFVLNQFIIFLLHLTPSTFFSQGGRSHECELQVADRGVYRPTVGRCQGSIIGQGCLSSNFVHTCAPFLHVCFCTFLRLLLPPSPPSLPRSLDEEGAETQAFWGKHIILGPSHLFLFVPY